MSTKQDILVKAGAPTSRPGEASIPQRIGSKKQACEPRTGLNSTARGHTNKTSYTTVTHMKKA